LIGGERRQSQYSGKTYILKNTLHKTPQKKTQKKGKHKSRQVTKSLADTNIVKSTVQPREKKGKEESRTNNN
jgi:hypothetical protein